MHIFICHLHAAAFGAPVPPPLYTENSMPTIALVCECRARQMGSDLVYVSGRKRKPGEMNGKSCNLNNCLSQIYPEGVPIPAHELVCIFDADQVANVDFFVKMVPLFDAGDDVGMVLSPQCFHNVNVGADIFNHCNINFWEYAQHGYDAFGFISCTGTNFLTRSAAFEQAGWSPEYTLTEDYALGMELTKRNWYCRYVEEYLAIGEAPEQVRNCFQQRSRWCKVRLCCAVLACALLGFWLLNAVACGRLHYISIQQHLLYHWLLCLS